MASRSTFYRGINTKSFATMITSTSSKDINNGTPAPSIHHCCSNHLQQRIPRAINERESLCLRLSGMQHDRRNYPPRARVVHQSRSSTPHSRPKTRHIRLLWSRRSTNRTIRSLGGRGRNFGRAT